MFLFATPAKAHVGSPDVFYEGIIGPYPAHVTIRMPTVVPGRAEIIVRADTNAPVEVSFRPLYSETAVTNAPPADIGRLVPGETNLYSGELWLMTFGGYSIEVKLRGAAGEGTVEIPVNSIALRQMPLPRYLGTMLAVLGLALVLGGVAIMMAAARDSVLVPGTSPDRRARRKGWIAGAVTSLVVGYALVFGNGWWNREEKNFRDKLHTADPPELSTETRMEGSQRILRLTLGDAASASDDWLHLLPDHGKLLHLFLVREGARDAFAHLHPIRKGGKIFEVALPALPGGKYDIFCDLTFEGSGVSTTATNMVEIPALPAAQNAGAQSAAVPSDSDPDDSWAGSPAENIPPAGSATNLVYHLPGGQRVVWKSHGPLHARQDAGLQFEVWDADGKPTPLEPYMGMLSHAAVLRRDGAVFSHLHPSGNYSMAAQDFYEGKLEHESNNSSQASAALPAGLEHSKLICGIPNSSGGTSAISLPYEFPSAGDYRIWVQIKTGGRVLTAVFDATVL